MAAQSSKPLYKLRKITGEELTEATIGQYLPRGQTELDEIRPQVEKIIATVEKEGDQALKNFAKQYDRVDISALPIEVTDAEYQEAIASLKPELLDALKAAKKNITTFHTAQLRDDWFIETTPGVKTGQLLRPMSRVGLYVPGGKAVYPSSVLMEAIPAKVAGVRELIVCSPPQKDGKVSSAILAAAQICGVDKVYRCGGAQAIAAMAIGTESIRPVQKIVGPGNKWVAAAKQIVSSRCGIDNPAGPSEILLVADKTTNPLWAAYDLLAQCEHGPDNVSVLLSEDDEMIAKILQDLEEIVAKAPRKEIVAENLTKYGLVIKSANSEETLRLINLIATEHLHLNIENARDLLPVIQNAGAIFLGGTSPVPLGDYCGGTNHVLPTGGYASVYSGLSTHDFIKIIDVLDCSPKGLETLLPILKPIAEFEGLLGHRDCVEIRTKQGNNDKKNSFIHSFFQSFYS